jgi:TM2 domain-containing membrane protein YozV
MKGKTMANALQIMPYLEGDEMIFVQGLIKDMNDDQALLFANAYSTRRKNPPVILLTACIGFIGFAGIHRFLLGHIVMGLLFFFTGGFCAIGTIVDIINHKKLAFEYNQNAAHEVAILVNSSLK